MILEAVDIQLDIDGRTALRSQSVVCRPSVMTALVGPSGSGKTTLLNCLGLMQKPTSGQVLLEGVDTTSWGDARRRRFWRDHASFVLQDYGIMLEESVAFNVTMVSSLWGRRVGGDVQRMRRALAMTGLQAREDELAAHLSGGERQRLGIARSIYRDATVLLVDEPTASLDIANRDRVIELLQERARQGCTLVVASHDPVLIEACDVQHLVAAHDVAPVMAS
ncbi:phosphonate-transporting ATPase [Knoellia sinensis KCTC 19936]|uniref:Phosphonate-transporting ATPase n=1 Tax=Knoellia sinensis KCTC 19936 TaxID=1385520 RepID=A0A0A0J6K2_9MICO|nr:ATP-binding cassette domain-containing protein [Knoellia sinensis]KGN32828.1 phosphonate-transporting ATPase [Knoellia sinensis KCTC 19936]